MKKMIALASAALLVPAMGVAGEQLGGKYHNNTSSCDGVGVAVTAPGFTLDKIKNHGDFTSKHFHKGAIEGTAEGKVGMNYHVITLNPFFAKEVVHTGGTHFTLSNEAGDTVTASYSVKEVFSKTIGTKKSHCELNKLEISSENPNLVLSADVVDGKIVFTAS